MADEKSIVLEDLLSIAQKYRTFERLNLPVDSLMRVEEQVPGSVMLVDALWQEICWLRDRVESLERFRDEKHGVR